MGNLGDNAVEWMGMTLGVKTAGYSAVISLRIQVVARLVSEDGVASAGRGARLQ